MIYFLQDPSGGPIKIGYSQDVDYRREQLQYTYGRPLAILWICDGDKKVEREFHANFADLRFPGTEQFRPIGELAAFLGVKPDHSVTEPMTNVSTKERYVIYVAPEIGAALRTEKARRRSATISDIAERAIQRELKRLKNVVAKSA